VLRIALSGMVCVLAVLAAGRITERLLLGANDAAIRTRIDRDVRGAFDVMSRGLRDVARQLADPNTLQAAAGDEENAAARLFDIAQAATIARTDDVELAVTAYGPASRPLAWAGRPSELPKDRLEGDEAWFIAQGALGLRLVYAMPVADAAGNRIGTIASEQSIRRPTSGGVGRADDQADEKEAAQDRGGNEQLEQRIGGCLDQRHLPVGGGDKGTPLEHRFEEKRTFHGRPSW
jgi:hypothetical protein